MDYNKLTKTDLIKIIKDLEEICKNRVKEDVLEVIREREEDEGDSYDFTKDELAYIFDVYEEFLSIQGYETINLAIDNVLENR